MTAADAPKPPSGSNGRDEFDAVVIGAGFAGLHMLHRLRESGFSVIGPRSRRRRWGRWYRNRYPGARCDSEAMYYSYSFLPESGEMGDHRGRRVGVFGTGTASPASAASPGAPRRLRS
jgi:cation diffusion facilitator CzcD-associated flavoprotein CzcO